MVEKGESKVILRVTRNRSQHRGIVRDFVIQWYADEQGEIFCRTSHVFVRRIEPPSKSSGPRARLDALASRALSAAQIRSA